MVNKKDVCHAVGGLVKKSPRCGTSAMVMCNVYE